MPRRQTSRKSPIATSSSSTESPIATGSPSIERPIAIISARGPSVLSASLVPPQSRLRKTSLLARDPRIRAPVASKGGRGSSDSDSNSDGERPATKRRRSGLAVAAAPIGPSSLLVADIAGGRHKDDVRHALETNPDARCLVEFCADDHQACIMTLYEDGFVWNQEAFLDRRSQNFEAVARQNPFMRCVRSASRQADGSGSDSDASSSAGSGSSTMVQMYAVTVHEIRGEDCPRLFA
ncbi:hypothetical protein LPJ61_000340 [Coemansia biformis]|uniref:Uncharacterized protein n=1 Tax=Coemansia biformis TaxID=1286918 RepID=A0A9W7YGX6_9FUNG|nr:hypothetical protein LPJ61_000340 [Coemansia biformis]